MSVKLLVTIGSYEKTLHGIDFKVDEEGKQVLTKKTSFSMPAHTGYIKAVSSGPHYLVSGSTDETVRIFDLRRRKDYGSLTCHGGSVAALSFYKQKMLFSGGEDGKIMVTRCADWETVMTLKGHSGGVHSIAVHPSGKLALSSGKDKMVKTWNLVTGKIALKTKLSFPVERIMWSPSGSHYVYLSERHLQLFQTDGATLILDHAPTKKVLCGAFLSDTRLAISGEGSDISVYDVESKEWTTVETKHQPRIKDIKCAQVKGYNYVVSGSSDGLCCLWSFEDSQLKLLTSEQTQLRITCLTLTGQ
jgi:protein MAK11